jgi:hypothetical protein
MRTLKLIRANSPPQDRGTLALAPPPPVAPSVPFNRYRMFSTTLDQLRADCGEHGEVAVRDALWGAVSTWLLHGPDYGALTNPMRVAIVSVILCRDHDRLRLNFPLSASSEAITDVLPSLSPDAQAEARLVAAETFADWERAGRPGITSKRMRSAHQYIMACTQAATIKETAA